MTIRVLLYARVNPADRGGVQAVFTRLAAYLRRRGHAVLAAWALPPPEGAARGPSYPLPLLRWRGRWPAPRSALAVGTALLRLTWALLRHRPQVVNVHFVTGDSLYFFALKALFRYRVVLSVHGSDVLRPEPWDAPLLARVLPRADAITAVSRLTADRIKATPGVDPSRVYVIPNGVDFDFWSAPVATPDVRCRRPVVLAVGRLFPVKGHDLLLRSLPHVLASVADARVVIVGDGSSREHLERLADELGIAAAVSFVGQEDPMQVRTRMSEARCFVLPSRSEGLPLALLEAMAAGLPAVATRVGGVPEVVEPGTGLLVPPEHPEALAGAITALLLNGNLATELSARGRDRARHFTAAAADSAYEALLVAVLRRGDVNARETAGVGTSAAHKAGFGASEAK